jgi:transposase
MNFSKPYPKDYRRPKEAEEILAGNLETVMRLLKERGVKEEEIAIGFLDETLPQLTANTVRVWSFGKPEILKNTKRIRSNTIGFYAIRGESISGFLESSKAPNIAKFLEKIKEENREYKAIITILGNFPSHRADIVKKRAEELGIYLVYLPSYSPDLNPIEFLWRSIKRVVLLKLIKTIEELRAIIKRSFQRFSTKLTYAKEWIRIFIGGYNLYEDLCN